MCIVRFSTFMPVSGSGRSAAAEEDGGDAFWVDTRLLAGPVAPADSLTAERAGFGGGAAASSVASPKKAFALATVCNYDTKRWFTETEGKARSVTSIFEV